MTYSMGVAAQPYIPALAGEPDVHQNACQILVADDDPSIVHLMKEFLQLEGHKVFCADDGQMVLRLARQHPFNLIILDIHMPMTNGLKVFEFLRASAETKKIPIIFMTGELSKDVYASIAEAPRVAYVKKPLDLESFNSLVRFFLDHYPVS